MTDDPTVTVQSWPPMDRVGTGFGGVVYLRSRARDARGHYRWAVVPAAKETEQR